MPSRDSTKKIRIDKLKLTVSSEAESRSFAHQGSQAAAPSLEFAQPQPLASTARMEEATSNEQDGGANLDSAMDKADPRKVADRVYELMQREMVDARNRGGAGRKR